MVNLKNKSPFPHKHPKDKDTKTVLNNSERKLIKIENLDEEWREIDFTDKKYEISNYGRVRSYAINAEGKFLKSKDISGFNAVVLSVNGKPKTLLVHKLVAQFFVPKDNDNLTIVTHIDWNKKNNYYKNLKWLTLEESYKNSFEHINQVGRKRNPGPTYSKLKAKDVELLKKMLERGVRQNVIAKLFCISEMQVTRIKRGENWGSVKTPSDDK